MKFIYLAGPYSAADAEGVELNVHRALDIADRLEDSGMVRVFIPHLSHYRHLRRARTYPEWLGIDLDWLRLIGGNGGAILRMPRAFIWRCA